MGGLKISTLRNFVKNGWTIANRKYMIDKIGKTEFEEIATLANNTGRGGDICSFRGADLVLTPNSIHEVKHALNNTNTAYHGSPFSYENFDTGMIGSGEGCGMFGNGIYLSRTRSKVPFYANMRSRDAVTDRIGGTVRIMESANPTVYTIDNINKLNLHVCSPREAHNIKKIQSEFEKNNPNIDGLDLLDGQIVVFPRSVNKLKIAKKQDVNDFVKTNKDCHFRTWTTDQNKLNSIYE